MGRYEPLPPLRVAVLAGGESPEREISLASGICVAAALSEMGHQVRTIDPAEIELVDVDWRRFDACFIALHGGAGEDGRVQQLLDALHIPYTGSRPDACQLAMSKSASKSYFRRNGVPTPDFILLHRDEPIATVLTRAAELGYPLVVKPDAQGSSLGVGLAHSPDELQVRLAESQFYDSFVLAERFVAGREFTVAVIDRRPLPVLEVVAGETLLSYDAKYHDPATEYVFDTGLSRSEIREIQRVAIAACEAVHTEGLARVDLRWDAQGRPWVLEINTVPGMTERSLAPRAAAQAGIGMPELCDRLLRACITAETRA